MPGLGREPPPIMPGLGREPAPMMPGLPATEPGRWDPPTMVPGILGLPALPGANTRQRKNAFLSEVDYCKITPTL